MDADDRPDGQIGIHQGRAVHWISGDNILFLPLTDGDDILLLLGGILADKSGVPQHIFQYVVGDAVQRQLVLAINVFEAGQLSV